MNERYHRWAFLCFTLLLLATYFAMLGSMMMGVFLGAVLASLTMPQFRRIERLVRGHSTIAAALTVLAVALLIVLPLFLATLLALSDADDVVRLVSDWYRGHGALIQQRMALATKTGVVTVLGLDLDAAEIMRRVQAIGSQLTTIAGTVVSRVATGAGSVALTTAIASYTLFFAYLDGPRFLRWLAVILPFHEVHSERLWVRFVRVSRGTVKGTLVIGLIQGSLGGVAFWAVGIPAPFFFTMLMTVSTAIPGVGIQIVVLPMVVVLALAGAYAKALGLLAFSVLVIASLDNLFRPLLVGHDTQLHPLLIFVSTLGGISWFGLPGLVAGPLLAALLVTSLGIYQELWPEGDEPPPSCDMPEGVEPAPSVKPPPV